MLRVAWPLIVSMGSFTLMQFCDRLFLARYSLAAIQAALPAGILSFTLIGGFMALAGYAGTFVSQYHGAGDRPACARATAQGIWLAVASWPLILALTPLGFAALRASGHPPEVLALERSYFGILMAGGIAVPLNAALNGFFSGRGDTRTTMIASLIGNVANVVLDYLMIFGRGGFPRWGIAGAAVASVIAGFVSTAYLAALYFSRTIDGAHSTRSHLRPEPALMRRLLRFGMPSAVHLVLDVGSFTLFCLWMGRLGGEALAASNIALSINNLAFMPLMGIGMAASILVGRYQGAREPAAARRSGWTSLWIGLMYMGVVGATFLLMPGAYFALFAGTGDDAAAIEALLPMGRWLLVMMAAWGLFDAANVIVSGALRGSGDTRFVMWYSVAMAWVFWIAGEAVILFAWGGGLIASWVWMVAYVILLAVGFVRRFAGTRWQSIDLLGRGESPLPPAHPGAEAGMVKE